MSQENRRSSAPARRALTVFLAAVVLFGCAGQELGINESWALSCPKDHFALDARCVPGCTIAGDFFFAHEINPINPCQICAPASHENEWSDLCLRAELYTDLPVAVHVGIDGVLADGKQSLHRVTQAWHSSSNPIRGALDFGGNEAEPGAVVRFSADVIDDVTPRYHPGRAFEIEVYAVVRHRGTTRLFFDPEGQRFSHIEEGYSLDVYYTNPISLAPVRVARVAYQHLDGRRSLRLHQEDGRPMKLRRVGNGEQIGTLAHVGGNRYTADGRRWTSGTHLHLEVTAVGWASWNRGVYRTRGYSGRFRQWLRGPRDFALHPDYEHRFPEGSDTGYRWWAPAFYFNDYHLHDDAGYSEDPSARCC